MAARRSPRLALLSLVFALSCFAVPHAPYRVASADATTTVQFTVDITHLALDAEEQAVLDQTNAYRASHGLPALRPSYALTQEALWKSSDMVACWTSASPTVVTRLLVPISVRIWPRATGPAPPHWCSGRTRRRTTPTCSNRTLRPRASSACRPQTPPTRTTGTGRWSWAAVWITTSPPGSPGSNGQDAPPSQVDALGVRIVPRLPVAPSMGASPVNCGYLNGATTACGKSPAGLR